MTDFIIEFLRTQTGNNTIVLVIASVLMLVIGFVGLIKGADLFVDSASQVAAKLKVPLIVIGLTIVAFGTSAPEAAVSISSSVQGSAGIAVGNVIGSNILNILVILGFTSLICRIPVKKNTFRIEIPFVIFITAVLLVLGIIGNNLDLIDGIILLVIFAAFMVYLFKVAKNDPEAMQDVPEIKENASMPKMIVFILLGLVMIVLGSSFTVTGATEIAKTIGVSDRIIGLTIVALGTSLPELVTNITAAKKGKTDIAIGNVIGSNIFNILLVVGLAAVISPNAIAFEQNFIIDTIVAIVTSVFLFVLVCNKKRSFGRVGGIIMLVSYAAYLAYLFMAPAVPVA